MGPETAAAVRTRARGTRTRQPLRASLLLPLLSLASPAAPIRAEGGIDMDTRVEALEARLEALTRRVIGLESAIKETAGIAPAAPSPKGEPAWVFDAYVQGSPFRVLQKELDRTSGRVDLLLDVVAQLPDKDSWASAQSGQPVPLVLSAELAYPGPGAPATPIPLVLERATRIVQGARIHLSARLDPAEAQSVRRIQVSRTGPETAKPPQCPRVRAPPTRRP